MSGLDSQLVVAVTPIVVVRSIMQGRLMWEICVAYCGLRICTPSKREAVSVTTPSISLSLAYFTTE
jgi:hypothetical protein